MICGLGILLIFLSSFTKAQNKFPDAIERSESAGRIIKLLANPSDSDLPKELINKSIAIGVFPKVEKFTAMFTHLTQGYGVISARGENGWTVPAFYLFGGGGFGNPFAKNDMYSVVLLFMTKDAVGTLEKGRIRLNGNKNALAGPVGAITEEQRKDLKNAQILAYAYYNGTLKGIAFGKDFGLGPDNKINTPLYNIKGYEVLAGKKIDSAKLLEGITAYQEALQKYCGDNK